MRILDGPMIYSIRNTRAQKLKLCCCNDNKISTDMIKAGPLVLSNRGHKSGRGKNLSDVNYLLVNKRCRLEHVLLFCTKNQCGD